MGGKVDVREVARRVYWREADARLVVDAWRRGGESAVGFARRHGVEGKRLGRWIKRLEAAGEGRPRFHPVRLVERLSDSGGAPIEIQLAGGQRVRVSHDFEMDDLRRVLAVLLGLDGRGHSLRARGTSAARRSAESSRCDTSIESPTA